MAECQRTINAMTTKSPRETSLWIKETVLLVNVKLLIVVNTFLFVELVVDTVGLVVHIAELPNTSQCSLM